MLGFKFDLVLENFDFKKFCQGEIFQNYLFVKEFLIQHPLLNQEIEKVFSQCLQTKVTVVNVKKPLAENFNLLSSKNENERILINQKLQQIQRKGLNNLSLKENFEALVLYLKIGNIGKIQKIIYEMLKMGGELSAFEKASFSTKDEVVKNEKAIMELLQKLKKIERIETLVKLFTFFMYQFVSSENKELFQDELSPELNVFYLQDLFVNNPLYNQQLSYFWLLVMARNIYNPQGSYFKENKYLIGLLPRNPRFYYLYRKLNNRFLNVFYEGNIVFQKKIRESWAELKTEESFIYNKFLELDSLDTKNTTQIFKYIKDSKNFLLFLVYFSENTSQLKGFKKYQAENL